MTRYATDLRLYLRDHARLIVSRLAELQTALIAQAEASGDLPAPGMTHLQHAQPVLFAHQLLAHVQAFTGDVIRLRDWDARASVKPLGRRGARRLLAADRPRGSSPRNSASPRPRRTRWTPSPDRDFRRRVLLRGRASRRAPCPGSVRDRALVFPGVRLDRDRRRVRHGVLDHAAEEEPGRRGAGPGQGGPPHRRAHRPAHHPQGPPAHLQQGPARGQGAGVRRG